jgi:hypothetical protein
VRRSLPSLRRDLPADGSVSLPYAVGCALALVALDISASGEVLSPLLLVATSSALFFFITSIGGAFSVYAAEVFPTATRARRSGVVAGVGKTWGCNRSLFSVGCGLHGKVRRLGSSFPSPSPGCSPLVCSPLAVWKRGK